MSHCLDREERLNDYLDDLLSAAEREEVDRHLEGCAGCREELTALRSLMDRTADLPRNREPERDLWPAIRASLPAQAAVRPGFFAGWLGSRTATPVERPAFRPGSFIAAAAAILVLVAVGIVALRRSPVSKPSVGGAAPAVSGAPLPAALPRGGTAPEEDRELRTAEDEYLRATEQLRTVLARRRGLAPAGSLEVIEANLRIVEQTIREVRAAAEREPGRHVDEHLYANLYRTQFDLLQQAVRLTSRGPEEPPS